MNSFQILINNRFTGNTSTTSSILEFDSGYFVYINKNGGGIVNPFNVRGYLNDSRNQQITNDFFNYLTGNTNTEQALNIVTSDQKLSDVFNSFYQNIILSTSTISDTAIIQQNLTSTTNNLVTEYYHPWSGYSENRQLTGVTESIINSIFRTRVENIVSDFTFEDSYYLPVSLNRNFLQIPRLVYEPCDTFISKETQSFYPQYSGITNPYFENITSTSSTINTLVNCFVDLNLELNENSGPNSSLELLEVSFEKTTTFGAEGDTIQVKVSLNKPSVLGFEEATIILNQLLANENTDFISNEQYPLSLSWAVGEQDKFLTFNLKSDFEEEVIEPFSLQIVGAINVIPNNITTTTVFIEDRTMLNYVSLINQEFPADTAGLAHFPVSENNDIDFIVKLDNPAYGVEKVVLESVSFLNTIDGVVGPATLPLQTSEYTLVENIIGIGPVPITLPHTISFSGGEISKSFLIFIKDNNVLEQDKKLYLELNSAQFCKIDQSRKMAEVTVLDDDGKYKFVHINLGTIYNEFGNSPTNTLLRQIDPQPLPGSGNYNNLYVNQYSNYLIEYGSTINFRDYSINDPQSIKFINPHIKLRITNNGTSQSRINTQLINPGASTLITVPYNNYIVSLSTNANQNSTTQFFEDASYKIELIDYYDASLESGLSIANFPSFKLRDTDNVSMASNSTINIGNITLPGYVVNEGDTSKAYKLKSKYKNVNTSRLTGFTGTISCPAVNSFSSSITYSEFYAASLEKISVLGIILLNYNDDIGNPANGGLFGNYTSNFMSGYDGFEFLDYTQTNLLTCPKTASKYNDLNYYNLPFTVEL